MRLVGSLLFAVVVMSARQSVAAYSLQVRQALSEGAAFSVQFRVTDDLGDPVCGATISGWMYREREKKHGESYVCLTDTNGYVRVEGKCCEKFTVVVRKDGYYRSMFEMRYPNREIEPAVSEGRWQPYGENRKIILKKIRAPEDLKTAEGRYYKIPRFGVWLGFDLEKSDWVQPAGKGLREDMLVRFITRKNEKDGFWRTMEVSFTNNPYAGAYVLKRDEYSEMDTVYRADTNADYRTVFTYEFNQSGRTIIRDELRKDEYMVFRTRAEVDSHGRLKNAHYGKMYGNWKFFEGDNMRLGPISYNPSLNDPNLESSETAQRSRLYSGQSLE